MRICGVQGCEEIGTILVRDADGDRWWRCRPHWEEDRGYAKGERDHKEHIFLHREMEKRRKDQAEIDRKVTKERGRS